MKEKVKVILADDHKLLLAGLNMQTASWEEFEVIATCVNGKETIEACDRKLPDVILMDIQMPILSGVEATRIIKERHPEVKIVALTTFDDHETVENALNAGVLSLQPGTVKNIVSMLLSKTFCVSRADLTRYAYKNNLADEE